MSEDMHQDNGPHFRGPFLPEFHLAILIPSLSTWETGFAISLLDCVQALNTYRIAKKQSYFVKNVQAADLSWSREKLVMAALAEEPRVTHILFLDADMIFPPDTIHWMAYRQKTAVVANYTRRIVPAVPVSKDLNDQILVTGEQSTGLVPISSGGLGVALFDRQVFDKVPRPWFDMVWELDGVTPNALPRNSEDVLLMRAMREQGMTVHVDHDLSQHVKHIGRFEYTNAMADARDWGKPKAVINA